MMRKAITAIYYTIMVLLIARVIMSWVPAMYNNPIGQIIYAITEPVLGPIRSIIPAVGEFDLSILALWFLLRFGYGFLMSKFPAERN